jgi:RluA family pseudouridine synthase
MNKPSKHRIHRNPNAPEIIYEDSDLLVVDKPAGLLTVSTAKEKSRTLYYMLTDYVRKGNAKSRNRIFIVHRLDREASGILVFAKNFPTKEFLQNKWDETKKKYLVVVHGQCTKKSETISSYLTENKAHVVYSSKDPAKGKLSHTAYKVLKTTKEFSLLEIDLITGRKHQIRVQLADIGHPIVGDRKYGTEKPIQNRLALHGFSISFNHPKTGKLCTFETPIPAYLNALIGQFKNE